MGDEQNQGKGLRTYLQGVPDPRRRQGRIYYSVKADFSVWLDLRNTLLAGYVGL